MERVDTQSAADVRRYLDDPALAGVMQVIELRPGDRPVARFRETWFHPQGGGQRADRGWIGAALVLDVRNGETGEVDHYLDGLEGLEVGGLYPFGVDRDWRVLNSRYHTAAHLLAGVVGGMFPALSVAGGHQWPGEARVDFIGEDPGSLIEARDRVQAAVQAEIANDLPVALRVDAADGRACRIGGFAPIPCSGTHVRTTGEIGVFTLRSAKLTSGRLRLGYDLG